MKKICIALALILISYMPVLAEYKPIPANVSQQYKAEMEKVIDKEFQHAINNVDDNVKNAKRLRDKILKHGYNFDDYVDLVLTYEVCLPGSGLELYSRLMKITQEKYLGIKYSPIETDNIHPYVEYLYTYFKDNNVSIKKLVELSAYENKQTDVVKGYIKQVEKLRPTNN